MWRDHNFGWHDRRVTERPWGHFTTYISNRKFTVKDITVKPGHALSLQSHRHRTEFWAWIHGPAPRITIGNNTFYMEAGREYTVDRGVKHRIQNPHEYNALTILEVAYGNFDEDDIIRYEDDYGRA